jgi:hypothetical protein
LLEETAKVLISSLEITATIILTFSIFRFQLTYLYVKFLTLGIFLGIIGTVLRDFPVSIPYSTLSIFFAEIILVIVLFRVSFYYSCLLCAVNLLVSGFLESLTIYICSSTGLINGNSLLSSVRDLFYFDSIVTFLCVPITLMLQLKKIGFQFIINHRSSGPYLKAYQFWAASLFLLTLIVLQSYSLILEMDYYALGFTGIFGLSLSLLLYKAYRMNRQQIRTRYARLDRKFRS